MTLLTGINHDNTRHLGITEQMWGHVMNKPERRYRNDLPLYLFRSCPSPTMKFQVPLLTSYPPTSCFGT